MVHRVGIEESAREHNNIICTNSTYIAVSKYIHFNIIIKMYREGLSNLRRMRVKRSDSDRLYLSFGAERSLDTRVWRVVDE